MLLFPCSGSAISVAAGRLSYVFAMRGPSISIDTACSSSLVGAHMALLNLQSASCSSAVVAGVKVILTPSLSAMFTRAGMLAPDGRCKTLDAAADGYVRGEALAALLLHYVAAGANSGRATAMQPPSWAVAVIRSTAVNQDGRSSSLTAPNGPAQQEVIRSALAAAGLQPHQVAALQLHGTGTALGDPIEVNAAAAVFLNAKADPVGQQRVPLTLAADKSGVGHTEPAAGLVGVFHALKAAAASSYSPILHLSSLNPYLASSLSPEALARLSLPRQQQGVLSPAAAEGVITGVSSFAFQGTNAHLLLQAQHPASAAENLANAWACQSQQQWQKARLYVLPMQHAMLSLGSVLPSSGSSSGPSLVLSAQLQQSALVYLLDHVVGGRPVLPGAAYLEMALAAGRLALSSSGRSMAQVAIAGVAIKAPLLLTAGEMQSIQLTANIDPQTGVLSISSFSSSSGRRTVHINGQLVQMLASDGKAAEASVLTADSMFDRVCASGLRPMATSAVYADLGAAGLAYGPAFRLLRGIKSGEGVAAARLQQAEQLAGGYLVHPSTLDNSFQLGAVVQDPAVAKGTTYMPVAADLFHAPGATTTMGATPSAAAGAGSDAAVVAVAGKGRQGMLVRHLQLLVRDQVLCRVEGLQSRAVTKGGADVPTGVLATKEQLQAPPQIMYEISWQIEEPVGMVGAAHVEVGEVLQQVQLGSAKGADAAAGSSMVDAVAAALQIMQSSLSAVPLSLQLDTNGLFPGVVSPAQMAMLSAAVPGLLQQHAAWGSLRSAAQEAQGAGLAVAALHSELAGGAGFVVRRGGAASSGMFDGYGTSQAEGMQWVPRLLPSSEQQQAGPYQLVPSPRGALTSLVPVPVEVPGSKSSMKLAPNQMVVEVKAVGINFRDVLNVLGMYPGDPGAPGGDCAGVVVGSGCKDGPQPGQSVFGLAEGCLGTTVVASSLTLVGLPSTISYEAAATMPTVFITADMTLQQAAAVQPGESVLVHAAAGGVGLAASQVLAGLGAVCVATGGSPSKRVLLRGLGVGAVVGSRDSSFVEPLAQLGGCDVLLNSLTSPGMVAASMALIKQGGRMAEIGKRDIWSAAAAAAERPDVSYSCVAVDFMTASGINAAMTRLSAKLAAGAVAPLPGAVHSLSQVAAALRQMSQARHVGKVVVRTRTAPPAGLASPNFSAGRVLVTGGTGTLGQLVAEWLAQQQQLHLQLVSRTGKLPAGAGQMLMAGTAAYNSLLTISSCDAGFREDLAGVVGRSADADAQPITCFMHAGGVLADATLAKQDPHGIRQVAAPKNISLQNWLRCSALQPVSSSVLFSSVASLLGAPGQSNYAAANAGLDGAAGVLSASGLGVVSCQWGAWAGAGMAAQDASTAARVASSGMELLQPQQGLAALEAVLGAGSSRVGSRTGVIAVTPFKWNTFMGRLPKPTPAFLEAFAAEGTCEAAAGKVGAAGAAAAAGSGVTMESVAAKVGSAVAAVVGSRIAEDASLMESGLDSLGAVELRNALSESFEMELPATLTFDYPSVSAISSFIMEAKYPGGMQNSHDAAAIAATPPLAAAAVAGGLIPTGSKDGNVGHAVVISGLSLRFAGGIDSMSGLYSSMVSQPELHTVAPYPRWDVDAVYHPLGASAPLAEGVAGGQVVTRFGTFLQDVHMFDPAAFNLSVTEAQLMDPQQRLLLQETAAAASAAGYSPGQLSSSPTGVFIGCIWLEYAELLHHHRVGGNAQLVTGNGLAFMAGRVSYSFGWSGPCVPTNTACSSSLVAAHLASRSLQAGECTLATAAGANVMLLPLGATAAMSQVHALAPDGRCKSFGAEGDGYGRGEGFVVMMLELEGSNSSSSSRQPLAVLRGSAVNQDGRSSGLTAPHGPSQAALVTAAMKEAGATALHYVASHGTGEHHTQSNHQKQRQICFA